MSRAENIANGLCRYAASHGPATQGKICAACAKQIQGYKDQHRQARVKAGICIMAWSHGRATRGQVCEACYRREQDAHTRLRANRAKENAPNALDVAA